MTRDETRLSPEERTFLSMILLAIAIMIALDILSDAKEGAGVSHMAVEIVVGIIALFGYGLLIGRSFKAKTRLQITKESLAKSQEEAIFWKSNSKVFIEGLSNAIDE